MQGLMNHQPWNLLITMISPCILFMAQGFDTVHLAGRRPGQGDENRRGHRSCQHAAQGSQIHVHRIQPVHLQNLIAFEDLGVTLVDRA